MATVDQSSMRGLAQRRWCLVLAARPITSLDDDVGGRLEQTDQLVAGRHGLAVEHPALGLVDDARDQRQIMA